VGALRPTSVQLEVACVRVVQSDKVRRVRKGRSAWMRDGWGVFLVRICYPTRTRGVGSGEWGVGSDNMYVRRSMRMSDYLDYICFITSSNITTSFIMIITITSTTSATR